LALLNDLKAAYAEGDVDSIRQMLMEEYDWDPEDVAELTDVDLTVLTPQIIDAQQSLAQPIKAKIIQGMDQYDSEHGFTAQELEHIREILDLANQDENGQSADIRELCRIKKGKSHLSTIPNIGIFEKRI